MTCVIVEDNVKISCGIKDMIDWEKLSVSRVETCGDGKRGLDCIVKYKADIALVDVEMPVMDGLKMAELLCNSGMQTKLIFISSYNKAEYIKKALRQRALDYILKPIDMAELYNAIKAASDEILKTMKSERIADEAFASIKERLKKECAGESDRQSLLGNIELLEKQIAHMESKQGDATNQMVPADENARHRQIVWDIKRIVAGQHATIKSVDDIALQMFMSSSYVNMVFRTTTGESIHSYLLKFRMEEAKKLLANPYKCIYDIASSVGYRSSSMFISTFRKHFGITPRQYSMHLLSQGNRKSPNQNGTM